MTKREATNGESYAGNPHVRSDEGEIASATPGAWVSTLHRKAHCGKPYVGNFVARFGLLFLVAGALQVHAGKYYLTKNGEDFNDASQWKDENNNPSGASGAALSSEHDYVVKGFQMDLKPKGTCNAKSMSIGEAGVGGRILMQGHCSFDGSDGLFLEKGCLSAKGAYSLRGKVTVTATKSTPFGIYGTDSGILSLNEPKSGLREGELIGDKDAAIIVGLQYHIRDNYYIDTACRKGFLAEFHHFENYKGLISVTSRFDNAFCPDGYGTAIKLCDPEGVLPGDLRVCGGGGLLLSTAADEYTVGELTLEPGSMIRTTVDLTAKKCNSVVASKLNVQGPICVMADYEHPDSTDGEEIKLAVLTAPANGLNAANFYFRPDPNAVNDYFLQQRAHLEVVTENGMDTLYLVVDPKGEIKVSSDGTLLLTKDIEVGELTLESESVIRTAVDLTAKTCNSVATSKLNVNGPICVMADYEQKASTDGQEVRCALLTAPKGVRLNSADFSFRPAAEELKIMPQRARLEVVTENDVDTLCLVIEPIVALTVSDSNDQTVKDKTSAMTKSESWSYPSLPAGGRHYYTNSKYLRFPWDDVDYIFPGKSLIHDGGWVFLGGNKSITVSNYVWKTGIIYVVPESDVVLKGKMTILDVSGTLTLRAFSSPLNINADISGEGKIDISNYGDSPNTGDITFSGDNKGYYGKFNVFNSQSSGVGITRSKRTAIYVSKADNLGGTLDTFMFDAISLKGYSRLIPTANMELPKTSNRGLFINGYGVIAPNENVTLRMEWPITMNGTLYKDGLGVLEMAGEIRFYDAETSASVENPRAETDVLNLYKGTLKIGSAKACDGLRIDVQSGTSILLPKPGTDSNLDKYGLYNVKAGATPFVLAEGVSKLPIAFEEQLSADSLEGMVTNALFTVANSAVDSVRAMLPYGIKPYQGVRASIVEIPLADEEATTFACVTKRYGLVISIK